jgi:uncharacterized membrane protein YdfJ with MMPL/SSD domain
VALRLFVVGGWAGAHRRTVLAAWFVLLVVVGGLGATLHGELSSVFTVPGVESQNAQELLQHRFPAASGGVARVVFGSAPGTMVTSVRARAAIAASLHAAATIPGVIAVTDPAKDGAVSADQRVAFSDVLFSELAPNVPQSAKVALATDMASARAVGLQVEFGGTAEQPVSKIEGPGELIGVVAAFLVLALALGSLFAAGLPLATALTGVGIGVLGVEFIARFIPLTNTATVLATMIGLAVGIDYALFIVSRHREQLADPSVEVNESIARAVGTAGSAVVLAGSTVIIALSALSVAGIPFLRAMGLAAAATVLIAVLIAITLVPALLGFAGERLRPRSRSGTTSERRKQGAWGRRWAQLIGRAPLAVALVGVIALLALASPARDLRLGLPGNNSQPVGSTQHNSYDLLTRGFGTGFNATLAVVIDATGVPTERRRPALSSLTAKLRSDPDIAVVDPPIANAAGTIVVLSVVPRTGPGASATASLVHRLRTNDEASVSAAGGTMYVAGNTAANIDVSTKLGNTLPLFIVIIALLAFVLLAVAFRSLLVPLTAVLGFLLSVGAGLGVVVWVFQSGHLGGVFNVAAAGPIVSFVPVLLVGVLFGLAMDYEVFLVSRMRESFDQTGDVAAAVIDGVQRSGRVVCSAALIMAAVFGGFIFVADPIIKSIAFALTIGVLIDAFVVRMTIIPAVMTLLGQRAWQLPRWLDRVLPNIDIDGSSLRGSER